MYSKCTKSPFPLNCTTRLSIKKENLLRISGTKYLELKLVFESGKSISLT
jgi:hypothetical protein